ncbi:hypothetical protein Pla163_26930 [Planctomycetes bacterium Pla163]|uniref:Uncharacterized protein n=1 Tax=Rohdeia mirabilis TaxID=2528008 RepID=A0A518D254_9BACT|nr:hypothetical protein Pla163_26930 [Planctomycetes bacterium Pla163]
MNQVQTVRLAAACAALLVGSSCASVSFDRTTQTSGTFRSSGLSLTILSFDLPRRAIDTAYENASDAQQPNTVPTSEWIFPNLGPLDWLLDIIGIRYAVVEGTWGFDDEGSFTTEGDAE